MYGLGRMSGCLRVLVSPGVVVWSRGWYPPEEARAMCRCAGVAVNNTKRYIFDGRGARERETVTEVDARMGGGHLVCHSPRATALAKNCQRSCTRK